MTCKICGEELKGLLNAHICLNNKSMRYGEYIISRIWISGCPDDPAPNEFQFSHDDYDGPEDHRLGHAPTIQDCKEHIDEMEAENLLTP